VAEAVRTQHCNDESAEKGMPPDLVVFPTSVQQVSEICKLCSAEGVPLIPHGTGTGMENGVSAVRGGVCVDLTKMSGIEDYHPDDFDVSVRPGVTREDLNHYVKDDGLMFTVDPGANASICGMCATGASGTNTVRYGTIRENVRNLEVVLASGDVIHTAGGERQRPIKSSAGYDLTNLFLGSEGTLGVITRATVRLRPQPEAVAAAVVSFPDVQSAVDTVMMTLQSAVPVARVELLDAVAMKACNAYNKLTMQETPTLFLEFNGTESSLKEQASTVAEISEANGGSELEWSTRPEERSRLWKARHSLHYACLALKPGSRLVPTDIAVPMSELPNMLSEARLEIEAAGLTGPLFGHVGDGNFHMALLFDPASREEFEAASRVEEKMALLAIERGGTCTGEHGVGSVKRELLLRQYGPAGMTAMKSIKAALDPKGIMNPGKIFL